MKDDNKDVGMIDDTVDYLADAIAGEKHALESYVSTKDEVFLEIAIELRRDRSKWLYRIVKEGKAEIYCLSKHLLGCSCRLNEMGNRFLEQNNIQLAEECFNEARKWENLVKLLNEKGGENVPTTDTKKT